MSSLEKGMGLLRQLWESSVEKLDRVTAHLLQYSDEVLEGSEGDKGKGANEVRRDGIGRDERAVMMGMICC
jgi:hypothetical protein